MDPLRNIPRLSELSGLFYAWTTAKADEYRQIALTLLAIHNLAAPIHRLPTEVLEQVFSYCWQDWKSLRLPHVCRLWRSILLGRAEFWADAVANCELREKREVVRSELPLIDALFSRSTQHSHLIRPSFYTFPPSIAKSLAPYVSSVPSLRVAVSRDDLQEGLWPVLLSGMPNLEALDICVAVTEEDLTPNGALLSRHSSIWTRLPILSCEALPKLSRLTCPHQMVGRFGDVPLRHLKAEVRVIDPSRHHILYDIPGVVLGRHDGLHLEPYANSLETLEIMPTSVEHNAHATPPKPLEFPSLRHLRIKGNCILVRPILSLVLLPQAAFVHISDISDEFDTTLLHPVVSTVDRVCLQQLGSTTRQECVRYRAQCFAGDTERLRVDALLGLSRTPLISIFGKDAPVTQLVLSVADPQLVFTGIDLHAFPHLVHLDVSGSDMKNVGLTLQPTLESESSLHRYRCGSAPSAESPPLSPGLTKLVITCRSPNDDDIKPRKLWDTDSGTDLDTDLGISVDNLFHSEWTVLQQALAHRASRGTRLTYLALRVRPATPNSASSAVEEKAGAEELEASQERQEAGGKEDAGCSGPGNGPESSSNETAHTEPANSGAFWPSHTARQAALQSLRELVDGPVILTLLDGTGGEISVEEV